MNTKSLTIILDLFINNYYPSIIIGRSRKRRKRLPRKRLLRKGLPKKGLPRKRLLKRIVVDTNDNDMSNSL